MGRPGRGALRHFAEIGLLLCLALVAARAGATVRVVLRYDDYSSFQIDPRVIEFERALFEGVGQLGGHLIVGVIPFPGLKHPATDPPHGTLPLALRDDKRELLMRHALEGTVTVALHGFNHGNNRRLAGTASEFAGLPEAQQRLLLELASRSLREATGLDARVFVPPFNQHDEATLRALAATGFEVLSSGRRGLASDDLPLRYLPETVHPQGMRRAVEAAIAAGRSDDVVVPTLHPYDFVDAGQPTPGFRNDGPQLKLSAWLDELRAVAALPGVRLVSLKQLLDEGEDLSAGRLRANDALRSGLIARHRLVPAGAGLYATDGVLHAADAARQLQSRQLALAMALAGGAVVASWSLARLLLRHTGRAHRQVRRAMVGVSLLGILGVLLRAHGAGIFLVTGTALCVFLGIAVGANSDRREIAEERYEPRRGSGPAGG